jgi:hypothetical protein
MSCGVPKEDIVTKLSKIADGIRGKIHSSFGTRPYKVFLVATRWTEGDRGEGYETLLWEREVKPTPLVTGMDGLEAALTATGREEDGDVTLSEISLSLSEAEVSWLTDEEALPKGESRFYEIRRANGKRRRYTIASAPEYDTGTFGWKIRLSKQVADRRMNGVVYR